MATAWTAVTILTGRCRDTGMGAESNGNVGQSESDSRLAVHLYSVNRAVCEIISLTAGMVNLCCACLAAAGALSGCVNFLFTQWITANIVWCLSADMTMPRSSCTTLPSKSRDSRMSLCVSRSMPSVMWTFACCSVRSLSVCHP